MAGGGLSPLRILFRLYRLAHPEGARPPRLSTPFGPSGGRSFRGAFLARLPARGRA
jgi:hypothetical protein